MFVDGEPLPQTTRALPWSVNLLRYDETTYSFEPRRGDLMDITWSGEVEAGWHDIHLGLFMERPRYAFTKHYFTGMASVDAETRLHQRLYVGIRNARVMTFTNA
jgi:hypothetical protein